MKQFIIGIFTGLILGIGLFYLSYSEEEELPISKIDSLIIVRDSIKIDTIKIKEVRIQHEKTTNAIVNNSPSEDLDAFKRYIDSNSVRLDSLYFSKY